MGWWRLLARGVNFGVVGCPAGRPHCARGGHSWRVSLFEVGCPFWPSCRSGSCSLVLIGRKMFARSAKG
jgi:hypothetical protein